jgi:hypothetical protein
VLVIMDFRISALPVTRFEGLFGRTDAELQHVRARRVIADRVPGFPCRVSLRDAEIGESVILLNFEHQPVDGPYAARHAIYVREGAEEARPEINEIPQMLRQRLISVRAWSAAGSLLEADVVEGDALPEAIRRLLAVNDVAYLHLHNAKAGCYAARVDRA